ncbi:MAG: chloride channel protein [Gammaproteobacteria bacterium]
MLATKNIVIELISIIICGTAIGLLMAVTANGFVQLVFLVTEYRTSLSWFDFSFQGSTYSLSSIASLLLAAIIISLIRKWLDIKNWEGIADSIYAAHRESPQIDTKKGLGSTLGALVVISGGGSVGQYGPLVHFGSTIGLLIKTYFRLRMNPDIFIGCGVAAAISAGFNAPLAGIIFAHEAILRHFSLRAIAPIFIASFSASAFGEYFFGNAQVLFDLTQSVPPLNEILPVLIILGPIFAIVTMLFMYSLRMAGSIAGRFEHHKHKLPFIAALVCGSVGVVFPEVLGLGVEAINDLIAGNISFSRVSILLFAKIGVTALCIGFGLFGGVFSPALFIGVSAGSLAAGLFIAIGYSDLEQVIIISGMAAVGASVIGAPITSVLIVLELTGSYEYGVAAMVAVIISSLVTYRLFGLSFFDRQLLDRGIDMRQGRESIALSQRLVTTCVETSYVKLTPETTGSDAYRIMKEAGSMEGYVVDQSGAYVGKLDIFGAISASNNSIAGFLLSESTTLVEGDSLQNAMAKTIDFVGESIPILSNDRKHLKSVVSEGGIFQAVIDVQNTVSKIGRA